MLKVEETTFSKIKIFNFRLRHFPDFSGKENSKSSQIQMFPDVSKLFPKK